MRESSSATWSLACHIDSDSAPSHPRYPQCTAMGLRPTGRQDGDTDLETFSSRMAELGDDGVAPEPQLGADV